MQMVMVEQEQSRFTIPRQLPDWHIMWDIWHNESTICRTPLLLRNWSTRARNIFRYKGNNNTNFRLKTVAVIALFSQARIVPGLFARHHHDVSILRFITRSIQNADAGTSIRYKTKAKYQMDYGSLGWTDTCTQTRWRFYQFLTNGIALVYSAN